QVQSQVQEIVQGLLDLHAIALEKILDTIADSSRSGTALIDEVAQDDLVGNVLLLYGLHPLDVETRVHQGIDEIRSFMNSQGVELELLRIVNGTARLRIRRGVNGRLSSSQSLKNTIEAAIYNQAPDIISIEIEGLEMTNGHQGTNNQTRFALPLVKAEI